MTPTLTKHLRPAYAECGGVFMKKNRLIAAGLLGLLWLPGLALGQEEGVQQAKPATVWQDLYYSRQEKKTSPSVPMTRSPIPFMACRLATKKVIR